MDASYTLKTPYGQLADEVLADLIHDRDEQAFAEVYNRYWGVLHRFSRRVLRDDDLAADAIQDIFTKLWDQAATFSISGSLQGYLYRSTRNQLIQYIRKERSRTDYLREHPFDETATARADDALREKELAALIEREVERLPVKMREVFELSRKAYLSYKEIAERTDIAEGTVRKQIHYALKQLRARLGCLAAFCTMHLLLWLSRLL